MHQKHRLMPADSLIKAEVRMRSGGQRDCNPLVSMAEMSYTGDQARYVPLSAKINCLLVALGAARMHDALDSCFDEQQRSIGKREECVRGGNRKKVSGALFCQASPSPF